MGTLTADMFCTLHPHCTVHTALVYSAHVSAGYFTTNIASSATGPLAHVTDSEGKVLILPEE